MQWGNIRFTIGLIVVIHLEKFLYVYFCDWEEYIRHAELIHWFKLFPILFCSTNDINNYECEPSFIWTLLMCISSRLLVIKSEPRAGDYLLRSGLRLRMNSFGRCPTDYGFYVPA